MSEGEVSAVRPHIAINVRDLTASIEFYRRLFGIEPAKVRRGYAKFSLESPPLNFTLNQAPEIGRGRLSHLGIEVASTRDVLTLRDRWRQAGLAPRDQMQTECCYALQDKAWVSDPDGNEWEVFAVLRDALPEKPQTESPCCGPLYRGDKNLVRLG